MEFAQRIIDESNAVLDYTFTGLKARNVILQQNAQRRISVARLNKYHSRERQ